MPEYSVVFPLEIDDGTGFKPIKNVNQLVKFNIKNTLLACPNERPMTGDFGFCMRKYLFEMPTQELLQVMHDSMMAELNKWMPYIIINGIQLRYDNEDSNLLNIKIAYTIPNISITDIFKFVMDFGHNPSVLPNNI